jgi:hypothetical protein
MVTSYQLDIFYQQIHLVHVHDQDQFIQPRLFIPLQLLHILQLYTCLR